MAINLSNLIGGGGGSSSSSNIFDFHAFQRTADGMLIYTLEDASSNASIQVFNEPVYNSFYSLDDYVDALPIGRDKNYIQSQSPYGSVDNVGDLNDANDKYQQYRFETRKVRYFIDDDGYLVARLNNNYTYTGPK